MKIASLIPLIASCVLMHSLGYASVSNSEPQPSESTAAVSLGSREAQRAIPSTESKGRKEAVASSERGNSRSFEDIHSRSGASLSKANRPRQVRHRHEYSSPENVTSKQRSLLSKPGSASKVLNGPNSGVRFATGLAISGRFFRNGRNRGVIPSVIGGPANTKRNVETINGTEVHRRHVNGSL